MLGHCGSGMSGIYSDWFGLGGGPLVSVQTCVSRFVLLYTSLGEWDMLYQCSGMCFVKVLCECFDGTLFVG